MPKPHHTPKSERDEIRQVLDMNEQLFRDWDRYIAHCTVCHHEWPAPAPCTVIGNCDWCGAPGERLPDSQK